MQSLRSQVIGIPAGAATHPRRYDHGVDGLSDEELARASGVDADDVIRYVAAGLLDRASSGTFDAPDIARTRLIASLEEAGVTVDDFAAVIDGHHMSLRYVEHLMPEPVRLVPAPTTGDEAEVLEFEEILQPILGSEREPTDPIREDDLAIIDLFAEAVALGAPVDRVMRIVRSVAQAASRLVDLQRDFVDEVLLAPAIESTGSPLTALEVTSQQRFEYRAIGRRLTGLLIERFVDDAIFKNLVQLTELALAEGGVFGPDQGEAIVFVDVSDFTRLSELQGDDVSAKQAVLLADYIHDLAPLHDSRLVKSLGDGAMVHAPDAVRAVALALDAVANAGELGLWTLHAGVNAGRMVRRDGDFYGTAVNIASRVAGEAGPGEVVVTGTIAEGWAGEDDVEFRPLGEVALKNVGEPVALYRVVRRT